MQYETLLKLVQSVIDSVRNIAVAHFNGLKKLLLESTFKVKVENPQTKVQVTGEVKATNIPLVVKAVGGVVLAINALKKAVIANKSVMITNLKDIKFPEFPKKIEVSNPQKEVKITNMREFTAAVEKVAEFVAKIKYDPRIEVSPTPVTVKPPAINIPAPVVNVPQQPAPIVNVEKPDLSDIKKLMDFFNNIDSKNPLAVQLSDGKKYYKALEKMADIYAGSTFSAFQDTTGADARAMVNGRNEVRTTISDTWDANDVDRVSASLTYFGEETADATWRVRKVTKTGTITSIRHATKRNNPDIDGYEAAWSGRADLDYGFAREAL